MAVETIYKLQPHRTIHLRGFDRRGATAAICEASATGFKAYGVFRDMADFAVIVLWDADNFFEHYSMKYLPNFDFGGMVLTFDLNYSGIEPIDSPKFNWIDWATLDAVKTDGSKVFVKLWDYATLQAGAFNVASGTITVVDNGLAAFDRVSLWLQNIAFDYIVPNPPTGVTATTVAENLRDQINQANWPSLGPTLAVMASTAGAVITLKAARYGTVDTAGAIVTWKTGEKFTGIAAGSTIYIAGTAHTISTVDSPTQITLTASAGTQTGVRYLAERGGYDGNMVTVYGLNKNNNLTFSAASVKLAGGSSDVTWRVTIDFTARGIDQLRQTWLTLAPKLADGAAYADTEWTATFSNWSVTDPNGKRPLKIAGPGSVRVGNRDAWAVYSGTGWAEEAGFFWHGFARRSKTANDKVTIEYHCQHTHDLWIGTSLYGDRGIAGVKLDGDTETDLDCYLDAEPAVVTRRKVRSSVAAGKHTVELRVKGTKNAASTDYFVYFDFLEAAKPADVQDPATVYTDVSPAIDFDTDHTYKLTPERLIWNLDRLGLRGMINEYVGVFWWNPRERVGGVFKSWTITFGGTWADGDEVFVHIGTTAMGKSVFPADTVDTIAKHFVYFINETFVGVWAEFLGSGALKVHVRTPVWSDTKFTNKTSAAGTITESGDLSLGTEGTWEIDAAAVNPINWPTRKWHADLFAEVFTKGWGIVAALSMEMLNPPESAGNVYAARFHDGTQVVTATGFANLNSTHCSFVTKVADLQKAAYKELANLMNAAGLTPWLQFGEFLWWFFSSTSLTVTNVSGLEITTNNNHGFASGDVVVIAGTRVLDGTRSVTPHASDPKKFTVSGSANPGSWTGAGQVRGGSMGYYDDDTKAAAQANFGRALAKFTCQDQDPDSVNGGADANWLRGLIKTHIDVIRNHVLATYAGAKFELLYPNDVNLGSVYHTLDFPFPQGGRLNRRVNLPTEYEQKSGSGIDRIKMEALSWGSFYRNIDNAKASVQFPYTAPLSWAKADVVYLVPIFNGGCPWPREYLFARKEIPLINFWAFDQLCLLSWPLPLPAAKKGARVV